MLLKKYRPWPNQNRPATHQLRTAAIQCAVSKFKFIFLRNTIYSTRKHTSACHLNDMLVYHIAITTK